MKDAPALRKEVADTHGPDALRDRFRGALLGLAVGNTLGLPVESWPSAEIQQRYPDGIREIDPTERRLPWDDDAAQAVILAEAIIEHDTFHVEDLAKRLVHWGRTNGRGIGAQTFHVIEALREGVPPAEAARLIWERHGGSPAGNGAVMRCAPVAMRWPGDKERLLAETARSASFSHYDPRCTWSAYAVNLAVADALNGRIASILDLADELERADADPHTLHAIRDVAGHDLAHLKLDGSAIGFTLKAMQAGLWCLEHSEDFEESLVAVINAGGDTDTNGAVAGAILGALCGVSAIPARWLENIYEADRLTLLADQLLERAVRGLL
jgi:ADP-ribosyl-[dinitrogen reductase] hydrolase